MHIGAPHTRIDSMHSHGAAARTPPLKEQDLEKGESESETDSQEGAVRRLSRAEAAVGERQPPSRLRSPTRSRQGQDKDQRQGDGLPVGAAAPAVSLPDSPFEVRWDGAADPMNPRCMRCWNKWLIVLIMASCAACVYVAVEQMLFWWQSEC